MSELHVCHNSDFRARENLTIKTTGRLSELLLESTAEGAVFLHVIVYCLQMQEYARMAYDVKRSRVIYNRRVFTVLPPSTAINHVNKLPVSESLAKGFRSTVGAANERTYVPVVNDDEACSVKTRHGINGNNCDYRTAYMVDVEISKSFVLFSRLGREYRSYNENIETKTIRMGSPWVRCGNKSLDVMASVDDVASF